MLSRCFLDCSVGVGVFVTGLSQISSFFSCFVCGRLETANVRHRIVCVVVFTHIEHCLLV